MKKTFRSQRREMLLLLITYTAAVTSRVNLHGTIPSADFLRNACEQQTHFWSSLLSLRKIAIFQRERSDDRKCVCCS